MSKKHILLLFAALLPIAGWADEYKDPDTKVIYTYTVGSGVASVKAGINSAGSPDATGNINILSYFTVGGNVYSVTSIGERAFAICRGLISVTIPNSVTSIGKSAFLSCSGLTSVTIPNSVTSIGSGAFSGCRGLTSVTIPNSVTILGDYAFMDCNSLTSITIPNSVTSIGHSVFSKCVGLTSVTIPNSVTSIGSSAFSGCSGLTSVTIPNSVTIIGSWAFQNCSGLTSVAIPNSVTSIGGYAFSGCSRLTSVTIPNSVTYIGDNIFVGCSGLTSIEVDASNTIYDSRNKCNAIIKTETNELLAGCKKTVIPNSVTSIGSEAFSGCSGLTSVTIPNSVTSIGNGTFSKCSGLISITIPNSVTIIGEYVFGGCSSLTYIEVDNSNTAFDSRNGCNAIIDSNSNTLISGCKNTVIPDDVTSIGNYAFYACSGLTSVTIPNSVTIIGDYAFMDCSSLTSVTIPNSVTSIEDYAFYGCTGLPSVTIPNSVTSIGDYAFWGCTSVTIMGFPIISSIAFSIDNYTRLTQSLTASTNSDNNWMTYYYDYANFQADENTTVYKAKVEESVVTLTAVEDRIVKAGQAVVLNSPSRTITMTKKTTASVDDYSNNDLLSSNEPTAWNQFGDYTLYVLALVNNDTKVQFCPVTSGSIAAHKAFLKIPKSSSARPLNVVFADDPSGIESVAVGYQDNGGYYDLRGQRVNHPSKGFYIANGKKVVVR